LVNVVEVELGDFGSGDLSGAREEDCCARTAMINDSEDGVMSIRLREANNEVHGYLLEWKGGRVRGDFVHCWASAMCDDLILLARRASLDIFCDPRAHVWPPIIPLGLSDRFVAAGMSGYEAFMYNSHDLSLDRKVWGDR